MDDFLGVALGYFYHWTYEILGIAWFAAALIVRGLGANSNKDSSRAGFERSLRRIKKKLKDETVVVYERELASRKEAALSDEPSRRSRVASSTVARFRSASPVVGAIASDPPIIPVPNFASVAVHFATNRKGRGDGDFGDELSEGLNFGMAEVTIPRSHEMGVIEKPRWTRLEFRLDPDRHMTLGSLLSQEQQEFLSMVGERLRDSEDSEILVFIHGYRTSFKDAALRTGQLHWDLKFKGVPVLFSWPSQASLLEYQPDTEMAEIAARHLENLLVMLSTLPDLACMHVIAHSMGNRPLLRTLHRLAQSKDSRFREIILASPDISVPLFEQLAENFPRPARRVTLYANRSDFALMMSQALNGLPRAGHGAVAAAGMETIDASAVDLDFLAHSGFGDNRVVMNDLARVLAGDPPDRRINILPVEHGDGRYWAFRP